MSKVSFFVAIIIHTILAIPCNETKFLTSLPLDDVKTYEVGGSRVCGYSVQLQKTSNPTTISVTGSIIVTGQASYSIQLFASIFNFICYNPSNTLDYTNSFISGVIDLTKTFLPDQLICLTITIGGVGNQNTITTNVHAKYKNCVEDIDCGSTTRSCSSVWQQRRCLSGLCSTTIQEPDVCINTDASCSTKGTRSVCVDSKCINSDINKTKCPDEIPPTCTSNGFVFNCQNSECQKISVNQLICENAQTNNITIISSSIGGFVGLVGLCVMIYQCRKQKRETDLVNLDSVNNISAVNK